MKFSKKILNIAPSATVSISAAAKNMKAEGKPAFTIDSKAPTESYLDFIKSENRYARLQMAFPERANVLFEKAVEKSADRYEYLKKLETLYK